MWGNRRGYAGRCVSSYEDINGGVEVGLVPYIGVVYGAMKVGIHPGMGMQVGAYGGGGDRVERNVVSGP